MNIRLIIENDYTCIVTISRNRFEPINVAILTGNIKVEWGTEEHGQIWQMMHEGTLQDTGKNVRDEAYYMAYSDLALDYCFMALRSDYNRRMEASGGKAKWSALEGLLNSQHDTTRNHLFEE